MEPMRFLMVKVAVFRFFAQAIVNRLRAWRFMRHTKRIAGSLMVGAGCYMIVKS
jgi:hypothetical protein